MEGDPVEDRGSDAVESVEAAVEAAAARCDCRMFSKAIRVLRDGAAERDESFLLSTLTRLLAT